MARCLIALGGNLNASEALFEAALNELERPGITPVQLSKILTTRPVGASAGNEFLNAAATLDCTLPASKLLAAMHEVESHFGRTRTLHWGPRTLDLDLLLFDDQMIDQPDLVIPHPAMWYRRFVLDPAVQVATDMVHPILMQTISELHRKLQSRPIRLVVCPGEMQPSELPDLQQILNRLAVAIPEIEWVLSKDSSSDPESCFSRVVVYRRSPTVPQRTQPANADSRLINLFAATEESAIDQLTQLSSAILGDLVPSS
jgi:2-amino-4-hydroxy-6-hydroxymethyldihydropteridine diphosphokinase